MAAKTTDNAAENAHYLNVTLANQEEKDKEELIISMSEIIRQFKRYFLPWFLVSVILAGLVAGTFILLDASPASPVTTLVSFTYKGIEDGKNPDGSDFQADALKSPEVIKTALKECDLEEELLESVRHGIVISPIVPSDAMNRITTYAYLYENAGSGQLNAAEKMMEVSWFSTQYQLKFNYGEAELNRDQAARLLNAMTAAYRDYFIRTFGYNNALGNALNTRDYTEYDYAEAVDMLNDSLTDLRAYINDLAKTDTVRFRSTVTGYTFADLRASVDTIRDLDLDLISSYITQNNVTKDKDKTQAYYEYKIDELARKKIVYEETLATITESIEKYQKDNVLVFSDSINTQSTTASEKYDELISEKIKAQTNLSETTQRIEYYNQRLTVLRSNLVGTTDKVKKVETDLASANAKVKELIELVEKTADDYYQNYSLTDAYNILVPASYSAKELIISGIKDAFKLVFALELVVFALYCMIAFISALTISNRKKKAAAAAALSAESSDAAEDDSDGSDDADKEDAAPAPVSKNNKNGKNKK